MITFKHIFTLSMLLLSTTISSFSQVYTPKDPRQNILSNNPIIGYSNNRNNPVLNTPVSNIRNQQQLEMFERDRMQVERMNAQKMAEENAVSSSEIQYNLPSQAGTQGIEYYYRTAKKLLDMLNGNTPQNLKEAVFAVENAFFEGLLDKANYEKNIAQLTRIARLKATQDGYNWKNPETKNIMLFRVMSDTLRVKFPMEESYSTSFPMQYDFDDFQGEQDY